MKRLCILSTLSLFTLLSCETEHIPVGSITNRPIIPIVSGNEMTKAGGVQFVADLENNGFKLDIMVDADYEGGTKGFYNSTRFFSVTGSNSAGWAIEGNPTWINETKTTFWAYNINSYEDCDIVDPVAAADEISFTYPKAGKNPDGQTDLLFAKATKTHNSTDDHVSGSSGDQISLRFYHALSKIAFDQNTIEGMPDGYSISSITLNGLRTGGVATFDGSNYTWTTLTGSSSYIATSISESFIVVPQNAVSATMDIKLTHESESPIMLSSTMSDYDMQAGMIYTYKIKIDASRDLDLTLLSVLPWDLESRALEIKEQAVSQELTYDEGTSIVNHTNKTVTIKNGQPVRGSFQLSSPKGAKVLLALDGNLNAFEVSPKTQIIDDNPVNFTITPLVGDPKIDYKTQLHLYLVHSDSTVSELDALVMGETAGEPNNYTIILPNQ